jgi:prophage regulatory protein
MSASKPLRSATGFMRLPEVEAAVGLARSSIYREISEGDFPKPVHLGSRNSQWIAAEVSAWIQSKIDARSQQ